MKALCDEKFRQIEGNGGKFRSIELSNSVISHIQRNPPKQSNCAGGCRWRLLQSEEPYLRIHVSKAKRDCCLRLMQTELPNLRFKCGINPREIAARD